MYDSGRPDLSIGVSDGRLNFNLSATVREAKIGARPRVAFTARFPQSLSGLKARGEIGIDSKPFKVLLRQRAARPTADVQGLPRWFVDTDVPTWQLARPRTSNHPATLIDGERLAEWINRYVSEPMLHSLRTARDGHPLTLLPVVDKAWAYGKGHWAATFAMDDLGPAPTAQLLYLSPGYGEGGGLAGYAVAARFPGFQTSDGDGRGLRRTLFLHNINDANEPEDGLDLRFVEPHLRFAVSEVSVSPSSQDPQEVRLGAVALRFGPATDTVSDIRRGDLADSPGALYVRRSTTGDARSGGPVVQRLDLQLGLDGLSPGGQDPAAGDEYARAEERYGEARSDPHAPFTREPPLILELPPPAEGAEPKPATESPGRVRVQESALSTLSQTVRLTVSRPGSPPPGGPATKSLLVLDRDPFLVAQVRYKDPLGDARSDTLATYHPTSGWSFRFAPSGMDLVLQTQAVGEAMEKQRSVEGLDPDLAEKTPAAYRFAPPTRLRIQPEGEARWNLRQLLESPGQREPGVQLLSAVFEMFYGMTGRIERDDLWLAEIGAWMGSLPAEIGPAPLTLTPGQAARWDRAAERWRRWHPLHRGRLALLEPRRLGQGAAPLYIREGVSYSLRPNARLRLPVSTSNPERRVPHVPPDTYRAAPETTVNPGPPLPGGFAWPFESLNLYDRLWQAGTSDTGELHSAAFSALGGWGDQVATFADGLFRISSSTTMGRTHEVTLEVFGRISVGWHRAKLVIVYERTVAPTVQFAEVQDTLLGRPALRKVREYVEILEPERSFRDEGGPEANAGPVVGMRFHRDQRQINVSSAWGEDVGSPGGPATEAIGFKVPLWRPDATPASVYPRPHISILCALAKDGEPAPVTLAEPEKLYFYTSTRVNQPSDPHLWPAVQGIDYAWPTRGAMEPSDIPAHWKRGVVEPEGAPDPDPPAKGGLGPFTFRLDPLPEPIDVVAGRAAEAVGARLRNVTLMRGTSSPPKRLREGASSIEETFLDYRDRVRTEWSEIVEDLRLAESIPLGSKEVEKYVERLRKRVRRIPFRTLGDKLLEIPLPSQGEVCGAVESQARRSLAPLAVLARSAENQILGAIASLTEGTIPQKETFLEGLDGLLARISWLQEQLESEASSPLRRAVDFFSEQSRDALGRLRPGFGPLKDAIKDLTTAADGALAAWTRARAQLGTLVGGAESALAEIEGAIDGAARVFTGGLYSTPSETVRRATRAVRSKLRGFERSKAFVDVEEAVRAGKEVTSVMTEAAVDAIEATDEEVEALIGTVDTTVAETARMLKSGVVSTVEQPLKKALRDVLSEIQTDVGTIRDSIDDESDSLKRALSTLRKLGDDLAKRMREDTEATIDAAVATARGQCEQLVPSEEDVKKAIQDALGEKPGAYLEGWLDDALAVVPAPDQLSRRLATLGKEVDTLIDRLEAQAAHKAGSLLKEIAAPVLAPADAALRTVRAFGELPRLPSLRFQLPDPDVPPELARVAYYYHALGDAGRALAVRPETTLTPILAQLDTQARDALQAVGSRLPIASLTERLVPIDLEAFDLNQIFPSFAGLRLEDLFPALRLPLGASDRIRVAHGVDPDSRKAWVQVGVDERIGGGAEVFSLAGFGLHLRSARFQAESRFEVEAGRPGRSVVTADIQGTWEVQMGGTTLVEFLDTTLRLRDERLSFDIRPDRVRLPGPLQFLSDLIRGFSRSEDGVTLRVTPTGAEATLALPLPDVSAGSFALSNLSLGAHFGLDVAGAFVVRGGVNLASPQAPFTLVVGALGGAGWFVSTFEYTPESKQLAASVDVGIMAAAAVEVRLGPISGGVQIYFGITARYAVEPGRASRLRLALVLRVVGRVSILGIATAHLEIGLTAEYSSDGALVGRGYVSVKIKICWCFTLRVRSTVRYTFRKGKGAPDRRTLKRGGATVPNALERGGDADLARTLATHDTAPPLPDTDPAPT
ncbi:hypothetical protein BSZ36_17595, partial [Rubricoccus marinus]